VKRGLTRWSRCTVALALALAGLALSGCATLKLGDHQPALDTLVALRESGIAPLSVGEFKLASGLNPDLDKHQSSRGNPIYPPAGSTFSGYLRASLISDLKAAGKFDSASPLSLQGQLTDNNLSTGMSNGELALGATFQVIRGGAKVFEKHISQNDNWESSIVGAIAIPQAMNHYGQGYNLLLSKLYADTDFRAACSANAK
jgi:hypothetical protein